MRVTSILSMALVFVSSVTSDQADVQPIVNLRTAGNFAILTKSGVSTTGTTSVTGDMGVSPIAAGAITGFSLTMDSSTTFSTSARVTGKVYAASYTSPTPSKMTTAISDMQTAYTDAAGRTSLRTVDSKGRGFINVGAGLIEGMTLEHGLYSWSTDVSFTSSLTFHGAATDVWILQISGDVDVGSGAIVTLSGGAKAENIFWQIAGSTTVQTTAQMKGVVLCATSIVFQTGSTLNGAALSQTAVTLDATTIVKSSRSTD